MKTIIITLIILFSINAMSQTTSFPPTEPGAFKSYTSKSGKKINIGDQIELGLPFAGINFVFINQNRIGVVANLSGSIVTIEEIEVTGDKKKGYKAFAKFKGYGSLPVYINIEPAINSKEIVID
jgi:hypothetical protein